MNLRFGKRNFRQNTKRMNQSKNNISGLVAEIADQIINEMSINDRIKMANLDESQFSKTNQLLILYIEGKLKIDGIVEGLSAKETEKFYGALVDMIEEEDIKLSIRSKTPSHTLEFGSAEYEAQKQEERERAERSIFDKIEKHIEISQVLKGEEFLKAVREIKKIEDRLGRIFKKEE